MVDQAVNISGIICLQLSGTLTAAAGLLYAPGTTTVPSVITWNATRPPGIGVNALRIQSLVQMALAPLLHAYSWVQLANQLAQDKAALVASLQNVLNMLATVPNAAEVLAVALAVPCLTGCGNNCSTCR